jgi:hypothetical protein
VMLAVGCIAVSTSFPRGNLSNNTYQFTGMSMRLAFDLGLHLDMSTYVNRGDITQAEADVRRAAFWGSYVADQ